MKKKNKNLQQQVAPHINQKTCEVCFVPTDKAQFQDKMMDIITCKRCNKVSHRICYDSTIQSNQFQCDLCQSKLNKSAKECIFCHKTGLLKKISGAIKLVYAHPICLLINPDVRTKSFMKLQFQLFSKDIKQLDDTSKCHFCQKQCNYGFKCWKNTCKIRVHLYCLIQKSSQGSDWIFNLKINNGFAGFTENLIFKSLSLFDNTKSIKNLAPDYKNIEEPGIFYCPKHNYQGQSCFCQILPQQQQIKWIQCDRCKQWYHITCLKNNQISCEKKKINQQDIFICQLCYNWEEGKKNENLVLGKYPKLQLYDHIYIHQIYQSKPNIKIPYQLMDNELICYKIQKSKGSVYYVKESLQKNLRYIVNIWQNKQLLEFSISSFKIIEKIEYLIMDHQTADKQNDKKPKKSRRKQQLAKEMIKSLNNLCLVSKQHTEEFKIFLDNINKINEQSNVNIITQTPSDLRLIQQELNIFKSKLSNNNLGVLELFQDLIKKVVKLKITLKFKFVHNLPKLFQFIYFPENSHKYIKLCELIYNLYAILNCNAQQKILKNQFQSLTQHYLSLKNQFGPFLKHIYFKVQNSNKICSYNQEITNSIQQVQNYLRQKNKISFKQFNTIKNREIQLKISDSVEYSAFNTEFMMLSSQMDFIESKFSKFSRQTKSMTQYFLQNLDCYKISLDDQTKKIFENYLILCDFIEQFQEQMRGLMEQVIQCDEQLELQDMINYIAYAYETLKNKNIRIYNMIYKKFKYLAQKQVRTQHRKFKEVMSFIFTDYLRSHQNLKFIKPQKLKTIISIMNVFEIKQDYYAQCLEKYQIWHERFITQFQNYQINKILEDQKACKKVLETLQESLNNAMDIKIDISNYMNKIKLLEIRVKITLKCYEEFIKRQQKIKILALKEMIKIMKDIKYPKNKIYLKLIQLDQKATGLMTKIELFSIKKVKKQDDPFQQLSFIDKKLTINEAHKFEAELQNSQFDFDYKIEDINQQILRFQEIQKTIESTLKKPNLDEIQKLYKYLIDSPLKSNRFIQIRDCLRKLKCSTIPKSRKELQWLLIWGSSYTVPLIEKTKQTRAVYKKLDCLQESILKSKPYEYIQLDKLKELYQHLLEEDYRQKMLLSQWEMTYINCKTKYQYITNYLPYNPLQAQNLIKIMRLIPIRNDKLEKQFFQKKQIYEEFKFNVQRLCLQVLQEIRLQENRIFSIQKLIMVRDCHNFYIKQFEFLRSQFNHYKFLKNSHFDKISYHNFLKQFSLLKPSFITQQIINLKRNLFDSYKQLLQEDVTYEFIKCLQKQVQFLIQHTHDYNQKKQYISHLSRCAEKKNIYELQIQANLSQRKIKFDQRQKIEINQQQQQEQQQQQIDQEQQDDSQLEDDSQEQGEEQQQQDESDEIEIEQDSNNNQMDSKKRKMQRITGNEPELKNLKIKENGYKKLKPNDIVILEDSQ